MYNWNVVRKDFPITKRFTYLQSAGMSPLPQIVLEKIISEYDILANNGDMHWEDDAKKYDILKQQFADILKTQKENIAFMANTSLVMSIIALTLQENAKKNFNIVSMQQEFPSTTIPFGYRNIKINLVAPQQNRYEIADIIAKIDTDTVAVVTSYVQYSTGFRQDLHALGNLLKERNILFIVNATQGLPFFPIDVEKMNIDVLCCSLHKWGCSGHVGSLFYTSKKYRKNFPSPFAGWLSVVPPQDDFIPNLSDITLHESADSYQYGTCNFQMYNTLQCAIQYLSNIGLQNIYNRIMLLVDYLIVSLQNIDITIVSPIENTAQRSAIVAIDLGTKNDECIEYLRYHQIIISKRDRTLRISINIFNNFDDIDKLIYFLKKFKDGDRNTSDILFY